MYLIDIIVEFLFFYNFFYKGTKRWVHYDYYRCTKNNPTKKCFQPYINQHLVFPQLKAIIKKLAISKNWQDNILKKIDLEKKKYQKQYRFMENDINEKLKNIDIKIDKLVQLLLEGTLDRQDFLRNKKKLLEKKRDLQEELVNNAKDGINPGFELFKDWIKLLYQANIVVKTKSPFELGSWFGKAQLNLKILDKKIKFTPEKQWAALRAAKISNSWVTYYSDVSTYFSNC